MKLAGVIVNYKTPAETTAATAGLLRELEGLGSSHVFIVDNDSGDGSVERLNAAVAERGWGDRVTVVAAPRNGGYGYGINVAVERSRALADPPEYLYVLNSDAEPAPGSLRRLVELMDARPKAGVAGSVIKGPDGGVQAAAFRFPTVWGELEGNARLVLLTKLLERHIVPIPQPLESQQVDWVPGTSMLIRMATFDDVGLFDDDFFLYFEEVDFCRRARDGGWEVWYVADAPIIHEGSVSTKIVDETRRIPTYWLDSRQRYFVKHHGRAYAAACDAAFAIGYGVRLAKRELLRRHDPTRPRLLRDFLRHSARGVVHPPRPSVPVSTAPTAASGFAARGNGRGDARPARELPLPRLLAEDFATYGRDLTQPGLWAVLLHRLGSRIDGVPSSLARRALDVAYRAAETTIDWTWGIHLPRSVELGRRVRLWHNGSMLLHAKAIGDDVHIRHDTTFGPLRGSAADAPSELPVIEDRADLGSGVCVLGNVRVGHDSVVGANSVVLKHVPPSTTVIGVPARVMPR
jgi:GT2 family glycosyltransferase/serine acetyltransferase